MSSELTQSGTPEGEPAVAAADAAGGEDGVSVSVAQTEPGTAPPSLFRPTMRDVDASEVGTAVAPRPLMPVVPVDGEGAPCTEPDSAADQALILGPSDPSETGTTSPVSEAEGGIPGIGPTEILADGTSLFGDRTAMWSGDPSEAGTGYGLDVVHGEACLCDAVTLTAGETA
ncbi:hypothetical protein [Methylobacterium sp. Gmos1]